MTEEIRQALEKLKESQKVAPNEEKKQEKSVSISSLSSLFSRKSSNSNDYHKEDSKVRKALFTVGVGKNHNKDIEQNPVFDLLNTVSANKHPIKGKSKDSSEENCYILNMNSFDAGASGLNIKLQKSKENEDGYTLEIETDPKNVQMDLSKLKHKEKKEKAHNFFMLNHENAKKIAQEAQNNRRPLSIGKELGDSIFDVDNSQSNPFQKLIFVKDKPQNTHLAIEDANKKSRTLSWFAPKVNILNILQYVARDTQHISNIVPITVRKVEHIINKKDKSILIVQEDINKLKLIDLVFHECFGEREYYEVRDVTSAYDKIVEGFDQASTKEKLSTLKTLFYGDKEGKHEKRLSNIGATFIHCILKAAEEAKGISFSGIGSEGNAKFKEQLNIQLQNNEYGKEIIKIADLDLLNKIAVNFSLAFQQVSYDRLNPSGNLNEEMKSKTNANMQHRLYHEGVGEEYLQYRGEISVLQNNELEDEEFIKESNTVALGADTGVSNAQETGRRVSESSQDSDSLSSIMPPSSPRGRGRDSGAGVFSEGVRSAGSVAQFGGGRTGFSDALQRLKLREFQMSLSSPFGTSLRGSHSHSSPHTGVPMHRTIKAKPQSLNTDNCDPLELVKQHDKNIQNKERYIDALLPREGQSSLEFDRDEISTSNQPERGPANSPKPNADRSSQTSPRPSISISSQTSPPGYRVSAYV